MRNCIAAILALLIVMSTRAESQSETYESVSEKVGAICNVKPKTNCWKPFADLLAKLKPPTTEREREDQLFDYWMLAKTAHLVGDLSESKGYYEIALDLAKYVKPSTNGEMDSDAARMMVESDAAALAVSIHDYESALRYLDDFSKYRSKISEHNIEPDSTSLLRCAALIGLNRTAEADAALLEVLKGLDFDGRGPWEGFPFGPQPLNPYDVARRIAAHQIREGKYDQALMLLQTTEERRKLTVSNVPKELGRGRFWAEMIEPAEILDDEAEVYIAQGHDEQAEPLLRAALQMREKSPDQQLQRNLRKLAALYRRSDQMLEATDFEARAAALNVEKIWVAEDPLSATLGFAN